MVAATLARRLIEGAVMSRAQFHALYEASPDLEHVELVEGVVYMPSPVKLQGHAREQYGLILWLAAYEELQDGEVEAVGPTTVLLDDANEPEPDAMLFRRSRERLDDGYFAGAPELVVEIANSSASRDLHAKKRAYERNGVPEYIVWRTREGILDWFQLRDGAYERREPDANGMIESEAFPGLRLDVPALLAGDRKRVLAALKRP